VLDHFGPARVVWGSDWPVLQLASGYTPWWQETQALLAHLSPDERAAVLGGNARRLYQLSPSDRPTP
jgi:L-fuconolactonase